MTDVIGALLVYYLIGGAIACLLPLALKQISSIRPSALVFFAGSTASCLCLGFARAHPEFAYHLELIEWIGPLISYARRNTIAAACCASVVAGLIIATGQALRRPFINSAARSAKVSRQ